MDNAILCSIDSIGIPYHINRERNHVFLLKDRLNPEFRQAFLAISAGLLSMWIEKRNMGMYENTFQSNIDYDVRIVTDAVMQKVTLYVPLPVHDNASYVGRNIIDTGFSEDNPSLATDTFSMYQYA